MVSDSVEIRKSLPYGRRTVHYYVVGHFITRHSLVRAKGEVFVLLYVCLFVCSVNDFSTTRGPIHAKVRMQAYSGSGCVFSPFGGWRPAAGGKRANEIFVTMGVNGEFLHFGGF